jgi:outer membrane protein assembly factor BamB
MDYEPPTRDLPTRTVAASSEIRYGSAIASIHPGFDWKRKLAMLAAFVGLCSLLALADTKPEARWSQFRGGAAGGVAEGRNLPETWDTSKNVVWKADIPGRGWSSPIVWGERIFVTSVVPEGKSEPPKKGLYFGGNRSQPPKDRHRWMVYCVDWNTGKVLWEKQAFEGVPDRPLHVKNSYASETPVTDGERVYAYFGNLGVFCYDMQGNPVWTRKWASEPTALNWGTGASPVLFKDRLFIVNDNEKESNLLALDAKTGQDVWRVRRAEHTNWATPFVWENEQRVEIVVCGRTKVRSYDLDGKPLWELGGMSSIVIPTPVAAGGLLYISSGYVLDKTRPVFAIRAGATGDISLAKDATKNTYVAWFKGQAGPYNPSPIVYRDRLYVLYDGGFLASFDARSGAEVLKKERIGPGARAFTSSPWAYNGKIFCLSEDGDTFVIEAGSKYKLVGKNSLDEMCMATPAIAHSGLLIRTLTRLYRIESKS